LSGRAVDIKLRYGAQFEGRGLRRKTSDDECSRTRGDTDLWIKIAWEAGCATIALNGDVDLPTAPALKIILDKITENSPCAVRIDLSATSFFACQGLSVLMATQHRLAQHGAALVVDGAVGIVRRVFILNGLSSLLAPDDHDHAAVLHRRQLDNYGAARRSMRWSFVTS
jgi:anti-anti-sigma factor